MARRKNPPKDIDSLDLLGGECVVAALSVVAGQPLPAMRRAFLASGIDIWGSKGVASIGTYAEEWMHMIDETGLGTRLVDIHAWPWHSQGQMGFTVAGKNGKVKTVSGFATLGQILDMSAKGRVAFIAVVKTGGNSTHMVAYSPQDGYRDNLVPMTQEMSIHSSKTKIPVADAWHYMGTDPKDPREYVATGVMRKIKGIEGAVSVKATREVARRMLSTRMSVYDQRKGPYFLRWKLKAIPLMRSRVLTLVRFREHVGAGGDIEDVLRRAGRIRTQYPASRQELFKEAGIREHKGGKMAKGRQMLAGQRRGNPSRVPPKAVQAAARRGLELRRKHGRGGTAVGVARARDLSNGRAVSADTRKRMKSFFARHSAYKSKHGQKPPSSAEISWLLWGGDAGERWVRDA